MFLHLQMKIQINQGTCSKTSPRCNLCRTKLGMEIKREKQHQKYWIDSVSQDTEDFYPQMPASNVQIFPDFG